MDDRELEARLRARLHRRFDGAEPPVTLRPVLAEVTATSMRATPRSVPLAWIAVATLIVAVVAGLGIRGFPGPGGPGATSTASPGASTRQYIVLPPAGSIPSKASTSIASDTLALRLRSIGIGNFTSGGGYAITFQLPANVDDTLVRAVLSATGELSFVPLPPEDYGSGEHVPVIGEPLPVEEPALFGIDQIASSGVATNNGVASSVHLELRPIGAAAFEVYTSGHVGETFAVLIDGKVALLPVVQAPITGSRVELTGPDPGELALLVAIVTSGTLPEGWREPRVPIVMPESEAKSLAVAAAAAPDAVAASAELSTFGDPEAGEDTIAAWIVRLHGSFNVCEAQTLAPEQPALSCRAVDTELIYLDAVSGADLGGAIPGP